MAFSMEQNIDLIAFAYHTSSLLPQFDTFAQSLIMNKELLPCVIVNSKLSSSISY